MGISQVPKKAMLMTQIILICKDVGWQCLGQGKPLRNYCALIGALKRCPNITVTKMTKCLASCGAPMR